MEDNAGGQLLTGSYQNLSMGASIDLNTATDHYVASSGGIQVLKGGLYRITYRVTTEMTSGNNRSGAEYKLVRNGGDIPGTYSGTYHRNNSANVTSATVVKIVQLTANDIIHIQGQQYTGSAFLNTKAEGSSLILERL
ncbi:MAG: hypothetical protein ACPGSD_17805 [Flavobacteriales bacterium]